MPRTLLILADTKSLILSGDKVDVTEKASKDPSLLRLLRQNEFVVRQRYVAVVKCSFTRQDDGAITEWIVDDAESGVVVDMKKNIVKRLVIVLGEGGDGRRRD